ncbi:MAG: YkgJ family cysteine cluster protein [Bacteroidales bacterium]
MATRNEKSFKQLVHKLNKVKKQEVDDFVHAWDTELFRDTDCLDCGNCCRNLGPMITDHDISRLAKHLKIKPSDLLEKYLRQDDAGYYVFKSLSCPFLMDDNYCTVYASRPKACREYPHTDRVNFKQIIEISIKSAKICPVVHKILTELNNKYG